ncbi:MAG: nucleoside triphosphate pyrophosphohydrolase [Alphaproteobacteria bacterium]
MAGSPLQRLRQIMARLRDPVTGCPWDVRQTFATIAPYTIEEAYEVADAVARGTMADLRDELGDLLLQVVFHARMAEEAGAFDFDAVATAIGDKLVRRHPHVFGQPGATTTGQMAGPGASGDDSEASGGGERPWEAQNAAYRAARAAAAGMRPGVLDDVPLALPALARAEKLQRRAARVGFDWPDLKPVVAKLHEEVGELEAEVARLGNTRRNRPADHREGGSEAAPDARLAEEAGDVLFAAVNVLRHLGLDSESALRDANSKFTRRFQAIEEMLAGRGLKPEDVDLAELEACWQAAKKRHSPSPVEPEPKRRERP